MDGLGEGDLDGFGERDADGDGSIEGGTMTWALVMVGDGIGEAEGDAETVTGVVAVIATAAGLPEGGLRLGRAVDAWEGWVPAKRSRVIPAANTRTIHAASATVAVAGR